MKILKSIIIASLLITTGCKTELTSESTYRTGTIVGYTTATILNRQTNMTDQVKTAITEIVCDVENYIPSTNETFASKWNQIIDKKMDILVENNKISDSQKEFIGKNMSYVIGLLDKYIEKKGMKNDQDLINGFIHGFCYKFISNMRTDSTKLTQLLMESQNTDDYVEDYLKEKIER